MGSLVMLLLLAAMVPAPARTAAADVSASAAAARTGKERLGAKASDEQRTNDCKVPAALRTRHRPDACNTR